MAEVNAWQALQERHADDITRAFRELAQRWAGIFDQEQARWAAVGQESTLGASWQAQLAALDARLALLTAQAYQQDRGMSY